MGGVPGQGEGDGSEQKDDDDGDFRERAEFAGFEWLIFDGGCRFGGRLSGRLGFEPFVLLVGWDLLLDVVEVFEGRGGPILAVADEIAIGAGEKPILTFHVFFESFEGGGGNPVG